MLDFLKTGTPQKKKARTPQRGNSKGKGFYLLPPPAQSSAAPAIKKDSRLVRLLTIGAIGLGSIAALLFIAGQGASPSFMLLSSSFLIMGGLVLYDMISRRHWERKITAACETLTSGHDRLVREVARNRTDMAVLKEGLGRAAQDIRALGRHHDMPASIEARMMDTLIERLGTMGQTPRAEITHAREAARDSGILEMEMAPPPLRPEVISEIDQALGAADFDKISDSALTKMVHHAVHNDTLDIFMQPVVQLPQRKIRMIEVFARIRAGSGAYLPARRYLPLAQRAQLVPAIDNQLLLRCLGLLRDEKQPQQQAASAVCYILNIGTGTLSDRNFMGDLVAFLSQNRHMAARLIFEMPQAEFDLMDDDLVPVLNGLSQLGCRFSIDHVRSRMIDINILKSRHIRFIKMDAHWLIKEGETQTGFSRIIRLKKQLDAAGIDLIVEKIETEKTLRELLDFGIDYGQGYLFGKPDHHVAYKNAA